MSANFIDDRCEVVRLLLRREAFAFVEVQFLLTAPTPLFRLRDRCDELGPPPSVDQVSGGLTRFVELPMLMRVLVRRVDDGPVEERVGHSLVFNRRPTGGKESLRPPSGGTILAQPLNTMICWIETMIRRIKKKNCFIGSTNCLQT